MFWLRLCKFLLLLWLMALLFDNSVKSESPTNLSHIVFGIASTTEKWSDRRWYVEAWWRPNKTRGYVFMDKAPLIEQLPWPSSSPPLRISEDSSSYKNKEYVKHRTPHAIRTLRVIEETFRADDDDDDHHHDHHGEREVRWFVIVDDDTVLFLDNLVEVLSKYDHRKYFYIGMNSESVMANLIYSFEMAFGGAGYALSYPLAKAVTKNMDSCINAYPTLLSGDHILQSCIADFGVPLTKERGFHQIDFRGDIWGFLSAHPQVPLISLHHFDVIHPLFPSMNQVESIRHVMKAAKVDESRLLQQSICYYNIKNWSLSVSWGYSVQIYEQIIPPSILQKPLETFKEWLKGGWPPFMFNSRSLQHKNKTCEFPHVLFFDSVDHEERNGINHVITSYRKRSISPECPSNSTNHSAKHISKINVLSPKGRLLTGGGNRRECCEVVDVVGMDSLVIKLRTCMKDEIVH